MCCTGHCPGGTCNASQNTNTHYTVTHTCTHNFTLHQVYRHGNSCSNIILDCVQRANCRTFDLDLHDAILTDFGQDASANLAGKLPKADIVMSSTLLRAMQTGLYSFPDVTVYPVPYLKEASLVAPSIPLPVADQKAVLLKVNGAEKAADVSFRYAGDADCEVEPTAPRCVADWNKFLKWLGNTLANYPPKGMKSPTAMILSSVLGPAYDMSGQ